MNFSGGGGGHSVHNREEYRHKRLKGNVKSTVVVIALTVFCPWAKLDTQRMVTFMLSQLISLFSALTWRA